MYCWSLKPYFIAVAQAESVAHAREMVLNQIGEPRVGFPEPELERARRFVTGFTPDIWHGPNAEFALTDSAELVEAEETSARLRKLLKAHGIKEWA